LEAKSRGLTRDIAPYVDRLGNAGIWLSDDIRMRILTLAGEE
jgi:predicted nucleic acid-binding protein